MLLRRGAVQIEMKVRRGIRGSGNLLVAKRASVVSMQLVQCYELPRCGDIEGELVDAASDGLGLQASEELHPPFGDAEYVRSPGFEQRSGGLHTAAQERCASSESEHTYNEVFARAQGRERSFVGRDLFEAIARLDRDAPVGGKRRRVLDESNASPIGVGIDERGRGDFEAVSVELEETFEAQLDFPLYGLLEEHFEPSVGARPGVEEIALDGNHGGPGGFAENETVDTLATDAHPGVPDEARLVSPRQESQAVFGGEQGRVFADSPTATPAQFELRGAAKSEAEACGFIAGKRVQNGWRRGALGAPRDGQLEARAGRLNERPPHREFLVRFPHRQGERELHIVSSGAPHDKVGVSVRRCRLASFCFSGSRRGGIEKEPAGGAVDSNRTDAVEGRTQVAQRPFAAGDLDDQAGAKTSGVSRTAASVNRALVVCRQDRGFQRGQNDGGVRSPRGFRFEHELTVLRQVHDDTVRMLLAELMEGLVGDKDLAQENRLGADDGRFDRRDRRREEDARREGKGQEAQG